MGSASDQVSSIYLYATICKQTCSDGGELDIMYCWEDEIPGQACV